jgi:predicted nucleic acid-binding protein
MIVTDASIILDLLLNSPAAGRIKDRLFGADETLHAPALLDLEIAQVLRRYASRREISAERGRSALAVLERFPIARYPHEPLLPRIWELRGNLTAYDAAYIALAEGLDATFLTRDTRAATAPMHRAAVEVL